MTNKHNKNGKVGDEKKEHQHESKEQHKQSTHTSTAEHTATIAGEESKEETGTSKQNADPNKIRENELVGQVQRLQAEFDNYRKRVTADMKFAAEKGQEKLVKDLLPIVDSVDLALKHYGTESSELAKGLALIHSQLMTTLENWGVTQIPCEGNVNPQFHEVYLTETAGAPQNTILDVLQPGYQRHGTVLRTAKVKAARKG